MKAKLSLVVLACLLLAGCNSPGASNFCRNFGAAYFGASPYPLQQGTEVQQPAYRQPLPASELLLFGGPHHTVFLGCLNCGNYDTRSIWNKYGDFGSRYSETSIWNPYGTYGSKFSDESPWNHYGQTPPVIVDNDGNFYGYFTANKYFPERTTIKALLQIINTYDSMANP